MLNEKPLRANDEIVVVHRGDLLSDLRDLDLTRVFISGGLDPDNVSEAAALSPYAVDVASGIESAPGIKDHDKLRRFIRNAKSAR